MQPGTFLVIGIVIAVDASRALVSWRASRRYGSAALEANALHFGGDLAGSVAVLIGLALVAGGYGKADSLAALFVAVLVLLAASRLIRSNIDVLMDTTPDEAHEAAREAIMASTRPSSCGAQAAELRGRRFADVVIGVPPGAAVGRGHAAADRVERAVQELPESDVVVHVEPRTGAGARLAAALGVPRVRSAQPPGRDRTGA